jgi:hypothetical protein
LAARCKIFIVFENCSQISNKIANIVCGESTAQLGMFAEDARDKNLMVLFL